ncbi:LysR family transcriptional regulator [Polaromonas sp. P1(28)-8]|nr:LysR family transcriptional regulator [Polaromonas sp. P1(28)-8]
MDINLARTFLEIVSCHSFAQAADRLHVTQTAISARVKTLEDLLGRKLFVRNRAGASLTSAGEQFVRHAMTMVQVWERARQQMAVPPGRRALVTVGCEISLWDPLMLDWLLGMRESASDLRCAQKWALRRTCWSAWPTELWTSSLPMRRGSGPACGSNY